MTIAVDMGRKATKTNKQNKFKVWRVQIDTALNMLSYSIHDDYNIGIVTVDSNNVAF